LKEGTFKRTLHGETTEFVIFEIRKSSS